MAPNAVGASAIPVGFLVQKALFYSHMSGRFFDEMSFRGNRHSVRQSRLFFCICISYLFVVDSCSRCFICIAPFAETMSSRQSSLRSDPSYDASDDYEPVDVGFCISMGYYG